MYVSASTEQCSEGTGQQNEPSFGAALLLNHSCDCSLRSLGDNGR